MSFSPAASQDQHWCDPDTYRVTYVRHGEDRFSYVWDVTGPDEFSYAWDVSGPRKDLLLESVLLRLPAAVFPEEQPATQQPGREQTGPEQLGSNP
jgi:hypothetical protein